MARVAAGFELLYAALAGLAGWLLLAMVALISASILGRNLGLGPIWWTDEASEYGLYAVTLLAAPWLLRRGGHVRIDALLTTLPSRVAWALEACADLLGIGVCAALAWYGAAAALAARASGSMAVKGLVFPEWWLLAPLPLAFALLGIEFVFRLAALLGGPRRPTRSQAAGLA